MDRRVLVINTIGFGLEGVSSVILNYLEHIDRCGLKFDFIVQPEIREDIKKRLQCLGDVYEIPIRKVDLQGYVKGLWNLLKKNKYDVIHIHGNSGTMAIETLLAMVVGVKKRIVHCHNTTSDHPYINKVLIPVMKLTATDCLACSHAAGRYLYGKSRYMVLNNAIDIDRFYFNPVERQKCRKELGIGEEFVIGHVGHFSEQKNQRFLVDVFAEYQKQNSRSKLLLVGTGSEKEIIQKIVHEKKLEDKVIFTGSRNDIERLYCAMDMFVFPSKWEGLPLVLVEAQISGLLCLVSNRITVEAQCTNRVYFKDLTDDLESWVSEILRIGNINSNRILEQNCVKCGQFDILHETQKLRMIYIS